MEKVNRVFLMILVTSSLVLTNNLYAHGYQTDSPTTAAGEKNEIEPNNDFGHATRLQPNIFYNGGISNKYDDDYFQFHSQAKQIQLIFDVENATDDFNLEVSNKVRKLIFSERVRGGDLKQKIITVPAGRKFIRINGYKESPYKLKVRY